MYESVLHEENTMRKEEELIALHEGFRQFPYRDSVGKLTIGYGFNLDDVGLTELESRAVLRMKLYLIKSELWDEFKFFASLSEPRQAVLMDMRYNMGLAGLKEFKRFLNAVSLADWTRAANEMTNSLWARQVGQRSQRLAKMMATGNWPIEVEVALHGPVSE